MKLGPLQEQWVKSLEDNPKKQGKSYLGKDGKFCCLGMAQLIVDKNPQYNVDGYLKSGDSLEVMEDFELLGLRSSIGHLTSFLEYKDRGYSNLASANDAGVPWSVIAKFIRENPKTVFTKSI